MENLTESTRKLNDLKEELFNYHISSDTTQDLTDHFSRLYQTNPEVYELLLLIYQEAGTRDKMNKKRIGILMNKIIESKESTHRHIYLLNNKIKQLEDNTSLFNKLMKGLNFKNIIKSIGVFALLMILLSFINYISPETFSAFKELISKLIEIKNK